jgi:Zn-dependent M28 family amino/carboxypeptidase
VTHLAGTIGPRAFDDADATRRSIEHIESQLKAAGLTDVRREPYNIGNVVATNLYVDIKGTGDEIVVVGAHYDTVPMTPGADDNASGVAGTLELARRLKDAKPARTIRIAFFACEEPPNFQAKSMGSLVFAKACKARGDKVVAMLSVEMIGYYSDAANSQHFPDLLAGRYPTTGNFLAIVGNVKSRQLVERIKEAFAKSTDLPIEAAALPEIILQIGWSDHWSFWQIGVPAVMLTDTAEFRNANYHARTDTPDTLDYARMAKAVDGIAGIVKELAE